MKLLYFCAILIFLLAFFFSQRLLSPFSDGGQSSRKSTYSASAKPNNIIKDTRPLTDKAYQQQEIQKITHFLSTFADGQSLAPKGINLKQLTTKLFVDIVNHLLCFFDENVCVNMTNYVSEIPLIMKRWGYVGNLNTSWLKTGKQSSKGGPTMAILTTNMHPTCTRHHFLPY